VTPYLTPSPSLGAPLLSASWSPPFPCGMPVPVVGGGTGACMVGGVEDAGGMVSGVVGRGAIGGGADITVRIGVREIGTVLSVAGVVVGGAVVVVVVVGALVDGVGAAVAALRPYELGAEPPTASATPPAVNAAAATAAATMMCFFCMVGVLRERHLDRDGAVLQGKYGQGDVMDCPRSDPKTLPPDCAGVTPAAI